MPDTADASAAVGRPIVWIVGGGGMLGRAVHRTASERGSVHRSHLPWRSPDDAVVALAAEAELLLGQHSVVHLLWCAGAGVVATGPEQLAAEAGVLDRFVDALVDVLRRHPDRTLRVFLSSSAGGVYAGSKPSPFSEATEPRPISPYGETKLACERSIARLTDHGVSVLVGRISNLYGPGQDLTKPQGIVTQLCRAQLERTPLQIYVSLDTARDYLFVEDAARMVLGGMDLLARMPAGASVTKILASHAPATLGTIIGELGRITKRRPLVVHGSSPQARYQPTDLRFDSQVWPSLGALARTPLPAGIGATYEHVAQFLRQASPAGDLPAAPRR